VGRLADFSSEQSQDAFIEVVELTADEIAVLEADGIELLNTKMEDGSSVTSEIRFAFENSLSLTEIALLSKALEGKGIKDFTASENGFSVIYLSEKSNEQQYKKWATKLNQTFKDYFNGRTNNYTSEGNRVRTWYHASDNQDTRSRTFKSVKGNLQTRYEANPGFGNKRRGTKRDNGKQEGEQEGSRDDIGESDVNHSLDTQQFFTDVENGKHRPSKDLQFILPLNAALKKIHQVWSKFKGHFDEHIETNIPVFREVQLRKINAILSMLPNGGRVIDLGGSTGSFVKAISTLNPKIYSENLDANPRMGETHNAAPVKNSVFVNKLFAETFDGATLEVYKPTEKFDVVHESMLFQFIKEDRTAFVDEIADNYVTEDGLVILEEKVVGKGFDANEQNKDQNFKLKYYDQKYLDKKKDEVLFGMKNNQATQLRVEDELKRRFKYVEQYWDGGNFKGYAASNSKAKVDEFLAKTENTSSSFSSEKVKSPSIDKQPQPTDNTLKQTEESGVTNPALKDVESTAKALEGARATDGYSDLEDLFLRDSGEPKRWFVKIGDALFTKSKGLPESFTKEELQSRGIDPQELNRERNDFLKQYESTILSEAYHKSKSDGSNPELVEAVESLLGNQQPNNTSTGTNIGQTTQTTPERVFTEQQLKTTKEGVTPTESTTESVATNTEPVAASVVASVEEPIFPAQFSHERIDEWRSIVDFEMLQSQGQSVPDIIKDAEQNWITKEGTLTYGLNTREHSLALDAIRGRALDAAQQVAIGYAIHQLKTARLQAQANLEAAYKAKDLLGRNVQGFKDALTDIEDRLDMMSRALRIAGSTLGRALYIRSQVFAFDKFSPENMVSELEEKSRVEGTFASAEDKAEVRAWGDQMEKLESEIDQLRAERAKTEEVTNDLSKFTLPATAPEKLVSGVGPQPG